MSRPWTCPHCNKHSTIRDDDYREGGVDFFLENSDGYRSLSWVFIVCPNPECRKFTLVISLGVIRHHGTPYEERLEIKSWKLVPPSEAMSFPNYIPEPIRKDYEEACLIVDLSPKASATLSRRCLQGIIRDFWGVSGNNLKEEIDKIKDKVETGVWDAIEAVRNVGNIGAHMEKDINVIIDVDPNEAKLLNGLIEILLEEWYIAREERKKRLEEIKKLGEEKVEERKGDKEES